MADYSHYAQGQWPSILVALAGLTESQVTNKHQPCPLCGGEDRYRFDDKDGQGTWFCNQCGGPTETGGGGNGMHMLMRHQKWPFAEACKRIEQHLGIRPEPPIKNAEHVWRYNDDFYVCRFPVKRIRPLWFDGTEWKWTAPPAPRPLYNLDSLSQRPDAPVLIVEGEKTADAAAKLFPHAVVITWPSGCKAINKADWSQLIGRNCTLCPDADAPGIQAMDKLSAKLKQLGAAQVRIVTPPPDVPKGWDLADAKWTIDEAGAYLKANKSKPLVSTAEPAIELVEIKPRERLSVKTEGLMVAAPKLFKSGWYKLKGEPVRTDLEVGDICGLMRDSVGKRLSFNELTLLPEYNGSTIPEHYITALYCFLSEHGYKLGKEATSDALLTIAREQSFHPVRQYLETIEADQSLEPVELNTIARDYLGVSSDTAAAMMRATLIGAVARVMDPGCQFDAACILKGAQGWFKSSFWAILASPDWFTSTMPQGDKDVQLNIHCCWIFELAELESITGRKDAGTLKNLITTRSDLFRAPYGKATSPHPRPSIFVGSVNNDSFLRDETGSRRYWVIELKSKPDLNKLQANRDAIWKAAVIAHRAGELPMLSSKHQAVSDAQNSGYEDEDPWMASISKWAAGRTSPFDTSTAIISAALRDKDKINPADARRVADCLRRLGFKQDKRPRWIHGRKSRFWEPVEQMEQIGTDKKQLICSNQTPVTPGGLAPLEQMEQIKTQIGLGNSDSSCTGLLRKTSVPSVPKPQSNCAATVFSGTDPSFASVPSVPTLSALGSGYDAAADGDDPHWGARP